ncbi:ubiquinone/menaquinone biosynthesis methyltransferase [Mycolicibacterium sp. XJ870]
MTRADLGKNAAEVAGMFDQVAAGYDRTRARLWWGRMDTWGEEMAKGADAGPGRRIVDVAAGTGTSAAILARHGARVVACDISAGMLAVCERRHSHLQTVLADAHRLPFDGQSFDAATISFGLRNMAKPQVVLAEMRAATRPGGRLVVCEFSMPPGRIPRIVFGAYLRYVVPIIGRAISSNPEAYKYLAESIRAWPDPEVLSQWISQAGWSQVSFRRLDWGIVHVHTAVAPFSSEEPVAQQDQDPAKRP